MITTATYILKAVVDGETYLFHYDHCYDSWTALEQFWHDDYPTTLISKGGGLFTIHILSMLEGKVVSTRRVTFNAGVFHAFFDHGHTASGPYTIDQFARDIEAGEVEPVQQAKDIIALWSDWCMDYDDENLWLDYMTSHPKSHCNRQHLQEKWDHCYEKYGSKAAMHMFWRELDNDNRTILTEYITTKYNR